MKRIPAPEIKYWEPLPKGDKKRAIRKEWPSQWLLSELLLHTINLCLDAYEAISARMLLDNLLSIQEYDSGSDTFFNRTYAIAYDKSRVVNHEFVKSLTPEERNIPDPDAYFKKRNDSIPQYQTFIDVGNFILGEYRHLPVEIRAVTDLAFQGFLFNALNSPDFASLCKSAALLVPAMTFEQKLDVELDHEALHNRLMVQLGHA